jgi:hypothetical protein
VVSSGTEGTSARRYGFDGSEFPLVRFTYPSSPLPAEIPRYYQAYDAIWPRGPHVLLVDIRRLNPLFAGAAARRALMKEVSARQPLIGKLLVAEARIVSSPVVRGLISAFEWTRPTPRTAPFHVCENEIEARDWLRPYLEQIAADKART